MKENNPDLIIKNVKSALENRYITKHKIRRLLEQLREVDETELPEIQVLTTRLENKMDVLTKLYKKKNIEFVALGNGFLALGARPSMNKIYILKKEEVTTIITLLKKEEKLVKELGEHIKSLGINWIWFPLSASKLEVNDEFKQAINDLYSDLIERLKNGEKVLIHCAAGVHRTGAFSNGLLRKMGFSKTEAKEKIYEIRPVTALEAITRHWNWSEKIIS